MEGLLGSNQQPARLPTKEETGHNSPVIMFGDETIKVCDCVNVKGI